ncbi:hypothetical protein GCM10009835_17940 [Planosporangium flavigriseum]|uniref:HNH endonuclease n=2 Tax=Planosporangium flavigriseum TaxID=373681 RepID=A0A8J3LXI1_9ACTN|nr:hypothetical protein Pfl04_35790 [Planosporangium flavigriseum]
MCYYPDCIERIVRIVEGEPIVQAEIAHICAANQNGPRYVADISDEDRRAFPNLIFLCVAHHKIVDRNQGAGYSIETLRRWKVARETPALAELRGLRDLTEDRLQEMIGDALESAHDRVGDALARLEETDREAASLLAAVLDEVSSSGRFGIVPDPDAAMILARSADALSGLPDYAPMMATASENLRGLPEYVSMIVSAAENLGSLAEYAAMIVAASEKLSGLPDYAPMIVDAAERLGSLPDYVAQLNSAIRHLNQHR